MFLSLYMEKLSWFSTTSFIPTNIIVLENTIYAIVGEK